MSKNVDMDHMRWEMIGMTSHKFPGGQNTSYYGFWVIHCVQRLRKYCKSSKMTKNVLRAVTVVCAVFFIFYFFIMSGSAKKHDREYGEQKAGRCGHYGKGRGFESQD